MNTAKTVENENLKANILIIGGGGAGLAAAVAAAEKGVKEILILEERQVPGGNAVFPEGIFAADSPVQKRMGIVCRSDDIFKKAMEYSHWRINPRLIRYLINKSGDTIRWLEEKGVEFEKIAPIYPNNEPSTFHVVKGSERTGAAVIRRLLKKSEELGVKILCQTKAKRLLTDQNGRVNGVLAELNNNEIRIIGQSVILATGGFTGNTELIKNICQVITMRKSIIPGCYAAEMDYKWQPK